MNLYFADKITTFTTFLLVGIIIYIIFLFIKREKINYWGRHILILAAWGLYICIEAATRDSFHLTVQNAIDGSVHIGLFSLISFPTIIGVIGAVLVIASGVICIFSRKQDTKKKLCYVVMSGILLKIVVIEISRILIMRGI